MAPNDVKRTVKIITEQRIDPTKPQPMEGYPMRNWSIRIMMVDENGGPDVMPTMYEKCTYRLHPSFEKRATQTLKQPPFEIQEEGWGEFDMVIELDAMNKGGQHRIDHDLNFQNERYEALHKVTFKNPKPELIQALASTGPVPGQGDSNGTTTAAGGASTSSAAALANKKKSRKQNIDMEKLAEGLQRLGEDDLLTVVQMVMDGKSNDTYTKNDVENGEFHVDLYTLPDGLVKNLWDYAASKTDMGVGA